MGSHICPHCGDQVVAAPGVTHHCRVLERRRIEARLASVARRATVQVSVPAVAITEFRVGRVLPMQGGDLYGMGDRVRIVEVDPVVGLDTPPVAVLDDGYRIAGGYVLMRLVLEAVTGA